ncbi:MAG: hypothetical protein M3301_07630, partial [Chloroflexota bacterium]|nr:hypothetical protein [Chloroflexota bacterium]
ATAVRAPTLGSSLAIALALVLSDRGLWLLGAAGFLARGGWLVLVVPILSLPSPVAITTLLGADVVGTGRLSPQLVALLLTALAAIVAALVASAVVAAAVDVAAFERFVRHPETLELRGGREPRELSSGERAALIVRLVALYGVLLLPAGGALVATALRLIAAAYQEYFLPGSLQVPLALRVAAEARFHLLVLALCLVAAEVLGSFASRQLIAVRLGLRAGRPRKRWLARAGRDDVARLLRRSGEIVVTTILGWIATLVLLVLGVLAIVVGWTAVRSVFLASTALEDAAGAAEAGLVTVLFVALWCAALVLVGLASAVRAALWSAQSSRQAVIAVTPTDWI